MRSAGALRSGATFHTHDTFRPYVPGPDADPGFEPGLEPGSFADAYRMLNNRIGIFVNLPFSSLDKLTLQKRLEEIGERKRDESA